MKKILAVLLSAMIVCAASGCASSSKSSSSKSGSSAAEESSQAETEAPHEATAPTANPAVSPDMEDTIKSHGFEGVIYAVKDGKPTASYASGKTENGSEITLDTSLPIGSVSKQFCAASILLLQEQGKLSVNDTLDKYYPDYSEGKKITLHNLLSMRSGIPDLNEESGIDVTDDHTEEENVIIIKDWVFRQKLQSEPDTAFEYANINYFLLSDIVGQVSGKKYADFLRESFFTPLGITHTGFIGEMPSSPEWAIGNVYKQVDTQPGLTNGSGDIISNAADLTAWINALSSGKAVSADSYKTMTTDYSPDVHYGYGLYLQLEGGEGHYGAIGIYSSFDYINTDKKLTLVVISNNINPVSMTGLAGDLLTDLMT